MRNRLILGSLLLALALSLCLNSGCQNAIRIGPHEKETITILHPGRPINILRNYTVEARPLQDEQATPAKVDIGGWVAMPPDHWKEVTDSINRYNDRIKELESALEEADRRATKTAL